MYVLYKPIDVSKKDFGKVCKDIKVKYNSTK